MAAKPNRLGATVANLRERKGLSQKDLGLAVGWSRQRVGQFELQPNAWPTPFVFNALANELGVPVTVLLRAAGVAIGDPEGDVMETLVERASQLDDDGREQLADIALAILPHHRRPPQRPESTGAQEPPARRLRAG